MKITFRIYLLHLGNLSSILTLTLITISLSQFKPLVLISTTLLQSKNLNPVGVFG